MEIGKKREDKLCRLNFRVWGEKYYGEMREIEKENEGKKGSLVWQSKQSIYTPHTHTHTPLTNIQLSLNP